MRLRERFPRVTRRRLLRIGYRAVGYGLRLYVACLAVVGIYSALWLAEIAGYLDERTLSTIWFAIAAMGAVFLLILIPIFFSSRSNQP